MGCYCVDNLPAALLREFARQIQTNPERYSRVALGVDARSPEKDLEEIPLWLDEQSLAGMDCSSSFSTADVKSIIKRFSETRRRHPLTQTSIASQAIEREKHLLDSLRAEGGLGHRYL